MGSSSAWLAVVVPALAASASSTSARRMCRAMSHSAGSSTISRVSANCKMSTSRGSSSSVSSSIVTELLLAGFGVAVCVVVSGSGGGGFGRRAASCWSARCSVIWSLTACSISLAPLTRLSISSSGLDLQWQRALQ